MSHKVNEFSEDLNIIQKLDDEPNDVDGLSADQLKAKFDQAALLLQKFLNTVLIPSHNGLSQAEEELRQALRNHIEIDPSSVRDNNVSVTEEVIALLGLEGANPTVKDALLASYDKLNGFIRERAQIVCGSYVGTGPYGEDNPNVLEFAFRPMFIAVVVADEPATTAPLAPYLFVRPWGYSTKCYDGNTEGRTINNRVTWGDHSVSWYSKSTTTNPNDPDRSDGESQLNKSGIVYHYIAVG